MIRACLIVLFSVVLLGFVALSISNKERRLETECIRYPLTCGNSNAQ